MKVHIALTALVPLVCFAAFGQDPLQSGSRSNRPELQQRMEVWQNYMRSLDTRSPRSTSSGQRNDNGTAVTVSVAELQHTASKPALKEYKKGRAALAKGNDLVAKEHLEKAVSVDPQFAAAHNDLGVAAARLGNVDQSIEEFQKASALSPHDSKSIANLALSLYRQGRYVEACPIARQALKVDPGLLPVEYALGISLAANHIDSLEALRHLERAAPVFPRAHVAASNVLVRIGRLPDAARHLEAYLGSTPKDDPSKPQVEARLALIRQYENESR